MKAKSLLSRRVAIGENVFAEIVLWSVPQPLKGSGHSYKYRLALVADGVCVLSCENEAGKGEITGISAAGNLPIGFAAWIRF
jgi:hypothetical protein